MPSSAMRRRAAAKSMQAPAARLVAEDDVLESR